MLSKLEAHGATASSLKANPNLARRKPAPIVAAIVSEWLGGLVPAGVPTCRGLECFAADAGWKGRQGRLPPPDQFNSKPKTLKLETARYCALGAVCSGVARPPGSSMIFMFRN